MKKHSPAVGGKEAYLPPITETTVVLFSSRPLCTSGDPTGGRNSSTEEWEEEDLSML